MADVMVDENGVEVRSLAKKVIEPRPDPEDLTRVATGEGPADYVYVDPCSLFKLERAMADLQREPPKNKSARYSLLKDYGKFVRELTEACESHWPSGGYVNRLSEDQAFVTSDLEEELPASTSGLITDIPGARVLDAKGHWVPVIPDEDEVEDDESCQD